MKRLIMCLILVAASSVLGDTEAYWEFDAFNKFVQTNAGIAEVELVNGYSGSDYGDAPFTTGIKGGAYQFDSSASPSTFMMMRDSTAPAIGTSTGFGSAEGVLMSGDFTVECFFNADTLTMTAGDAFDAGATLVAIRRVDNMFNYRLMLYKETNFSDVTLAAQYHDASGSLHTVTLGSVVSTGTWYYAAARWDGTAESFSVSMLDMEGAGATLTTSSLVTSGVSPDGSDTVNDIFMIGGTPLSNMNPASSGRYTGILDEVRISSSYLADGELLYSAQYASWESNYALVEGPYGDDDSDGLVNLYEYGLGGDPTNSADQGISPEYTIAEENGTNWFGYVYPVLSDPFNGLLYYLEVTDDLIVSSWTNSGYDITGIATDGEFNYVSNRVSTVDDGQLFIRLIIKKK